MSLRALRGYLLSSLIAIIMTGGILGCSSDDNPTEPPPGQPNPTSGVFLDSPVEGLGYSSGADSGLTTSTGEFSFDGSTVSFFVGDIQMGSTSSATAITPVELAGDRDVTDPHTTNIARFLQTIDDDGDPNNGILITAAVRQAALGKTIDFDRSIAAFETDPVVLACIDTLTSRTTAGTRPLVSALAAQGHLGNTVITARQGSYSGGFGPLEGREEFPTTQTGSWSFVITEGGVVAGNGTINGFAVSINGILATDGSVLGSSLEEGTTYFFEITITGALSGMWYGPGEIIASMSGNRN